MPEIPEIPEIPETYDYTYLSLGAGVQSSALLVLACTDSRVPMPNIAVFADTGDEPPWVYDYVKALTIWAEPYGLEIRTVSKGRLSESVLGQNRYVGVPLFTKADSNSSRARGGMLRRQCTREFKIAPIIQEVRKTLGYKKRFRVKEKVRAMLGITTDEAQRMKPSWLKWVTNTYPLIDLGMSRSDCYAVLASAGLPEPQKSACVFCPYHSDAYWGWLKATHPEQFQQAVSFDVAIRNKTMRGKSHLAYVHGSRQPLGEVQFTTEEYQLDMLGECEGMCGV